MSVSFFIIYDYLCLYNFIYTTFGGTFLLFFFHHQKMLILLFSFLSR